MIGRIIAAIAFIAGGAITYFVLAVLKGFGASQAAMSAGPVPAPSAMEVLIPFLACSYFVVSAMGVLFCRSRAALRVAALVAPSLLLTAFVSICVGGLRGDPVKFLSGFVTLSLITVVFFSPWFIIWAVLVFRDATPAQPGAAPNDGPVATLVNSGVSQGPPSVT